MASPAGADDDRHLFAGVRFVLVGFDTVSESQYRAEMLRRGGADAGRLGGGCTHVVACGRVYDDPVCVAARAQGNKVVSELWVDDSLDRAALVDADRVIYWPTRDLNGIPGSESLQICLTGYQRNDREDIMKMVSLMGAHFSKPLVGGVVTHLVCYKFEGEKYELAKRLSIKLVNHRWLEDCLKSWEILPVDDYKKSSWELEMMEVQVKDSDDEVEDVDRKPFNSRSSVKRTPNPPNSIGTSGNPDVDAPIQPPIIPNNDQNMAVDRHLNTPRTQIRKEENMVKETHDTTTQLQGTPNFSRLASSANTDSAAPIQTSFVISVNREEAAVRNMNSPNQIQAADEYVNTSGQIRKDEDMVNKTHDIIAQGTPDLSRFASSTNTDIGAPLQPPFVISGNREEAAARNLNSPNQVQAAKYKYVGLDIATGAPGTPSSSRMPVPANHHVHSSNETLTVPKNTATPRARKTGAKRPRSASMEVDGSVVNNGKAVVSESETDKMIPSQHADATPKNAPSIASATEPKTISAGKKQYHHRLGTGGYKTVIPKWEALEAGLLAKRITPQTADWPERSKFWLCAHGAGLDPQTGHIVAQGRWKDKIANITVQLVDAIDKVRRGEYHPERENHELTLALGNLEHYGRLRGHPGGVTLKEGFPECADSYRSRGRKKKNVLDRLSELERQVQRQQQQQIDSIIQQRASQQLQLEDPQADAIPSQQKSSSVGST